MHCPNCQKTVGVIFVLYYISMYSLTPQLLANFPYSQYANPQSIQRGREYHKRGNVWNIELTGDNKAICFVEGHSGEYEVTIEVNKKGELLFDCDCSYADEGNFCKHMVAAALELSEYLKDEEDFNEDGEDEDEYDEDNIIPACPPTPGGNWQNKLKETLASVPRRSSTSPNLSRYVAVILLTRSQMGYYGYGSAASPSYHYSLEPLIIKSNEWYGLAGGEKKSPQEINEFLETNKKWIKAGERMFQQVNPAGCLNLNQEAVSFLNSNLKRNAHVWHRHQQCVHVPVHACQTGSACFPRQFLP